MNSTSDVRSKSAGHVERSLKLARKKELEGEIPRQNSTGAEIVVNSKYSIYQNFPIHSSPYIQTQTKQHRTMGLIPACDSYETCKYLIFVPG